MTWIVKQFHLATTPSHRTHEKARYYKRVQFPCPSWLNGVIGIMICTQPPEQGKKRERGDTITTFCHGVLGFQPRHNHRHITFANHFATGQSDAMKISIAKKKKNKNERQKKRIQQHPKGNNPTPIVQTKKPTKDQSCRSCPFGSALAEAVGKPRAKPNSAGPSDAEARLTSSLAPTGPTNNN